MQRIVPVILPVSAFAAHSQLATARGPAGGPGAGGGAPHFGGPSSSSQAAANSNGRFAADRETGLDRAKDVSAVALERVALHPDAMSVTDIDAVARPTFDRVEVRSRLTAAMAPGVLLATFSPSSVSVVARFCAPVFLTEIGQDYKAPSRGATALCARYCSFYCANRIVTTGLPVVTMRGNRRQYRLLALILFFPQ